MVKPTILKTVTERYRCYTFLSSARWLLVNAHRTTLVGTVNGTRDFWLWPWQLSGLGPNDQAERELCRAGFRLTKVNHSQPCGWGQRRSQLAAVAQSCPWQQLLMAVLCPKQSGDNISRIKGLMWDWLCMYQLVKRKQWKNITQTWVTRFFLELQCCLD